MILKIWNKSRAMEKPAGFLYLEKVESEITFQYDPYHTN